MPVPAMGFTYQEPTTFDRQRAIEYLEKTRDQVCECTHRLSEVQLTFKPAPDQWSVLENLEHVAIVEGFVRVRLAALAQSEPADLNRNIAELDTMVLTKVPDRSSRFKTPEPGEPKGRWSHTETLERYRALRAELIGIAASDPALLAYTQPHPVLGALDGYQGLLAAGAHTDRHRQQMLEVKADPNFPHN